LKWKEIWRGKKRQCSGYSKQNMEGRKEKKPAERTETKSLRGMYQNKTLHNARKGGQEKDEGEGLNLNNDIDKTCTGEREQGGITARVYITFRAKMHPSYRWCASDNQRAEKAR
jgi:hypothetical protein